MRKTVLVVASMFLVMLLASGVAWATINCKAGNPCKGDDSRNVMFGFNGSDIMRGLGAADSMVGKTGATRCTVVPAPRVAATRATCSAASATM